MRTFRPVRRKFENRKGFTLFELIIYVTIVGLFLLSAINLALQVLDGSEKERSYLEVSQNARFAVDKITRAIRAASDLNTGSSTFNTNPGVLSLAMSNGAVNPTVFDISGGRLRITEGVGAPVFLTTDKVNISNLVFKDFSVANKTRTVEILLTADHVNPGNNSVYQASVSLDGNAVIRVKEK